MKQWGKTPHMTNAGFWADIAHFSGAAFWCLSSLSTRSTSGGFSGRAHGAAPRGLWSTLLELCSLGLLCLIHFWDIKAAPAMWHPCPNNLSSISWLLSAIIWYMGVFATTGLVSGACWLRQMLWAGMGSLGLPGMVAPNDPKHCLRARLFPALCSLAVAGLGRILIS